MIYTLFLFLYHFFLVRMQQEQQQKAWNELLKSQKRFMMMTIITKMIRINRVFFKEPTLFFTIFFLVLILPLVHIYIFDNAFMGEYQSIGMKISLILVLFIDISLVQSFLWKIDFRSEYIANDFSDVSVKEEKTHKGYLLSESDPVEKKEALKSDPVEKKEALKSDPVEKKEALKSDPVEKKSIFVGRPLTRFSPYSEFEGFGFGNMAGLIETPKYVVLEDDFKTILRDSLREIIELDEKTKATFSSSVTSGRSSTRKSDESQQLFLCQAE
eukprot:TRINITY_DN4793_c0_g1_i2.p1 TRINITY_DN4793_c0_g1~~TRINITY_DN4793_c0_g1_i2.p1  ORF type:complete len:271 (+),score=5.88 TRINITY_DN4793_c0_g1_i2:463-1275(+)